MHFKVVEFSTGWKTSSREVVEVVEGPSKQADEQRKKARWVYQYSGFLRRIGGVSSARETVRAVEIKFESISMRIGSQRRREAFQSGRPNLCSIFDFNLSGILGMDCRF